MSISLVAPACLLVVTGMTAVVVDTGNLYYNKMKLQQIADQAATGAALAINSQYDPKARAKDLIAKNSPASFGPNVALDGDIQLGHYDTGSGFVANGAPSNAIQVTTYRAADTGHNNPVITYFGRILGKYAVNMTASAVAVKYGGACVIVLDQLNDSQTLLLKGNPQIVADCPIQVNSSSTTAAYATGASCVSAPLVAVVGGASPLSVFQGCPGISQPQQVVVTKTGSPLSDPLGLSPPARPPLKCSKTTFNSEVMPSGCYYTGKISLSGDMTLQDNSIYYFYNASFSVGSNTNLSGNGVMLFLDQTSQMSLGGGGTIKLTGWTGSDKYAGVLIYQDGTAPHTTTLSLGGNGVMSLNGTVYAPSVNLLLNGTSGLTGKYGYLIGYTITLTGNGSIQFDAFPNTGTTPPSMRTHSGKVI